MKAKSIKELADELDTAASAFADAVEEAVPPQMMTTKLRRVLDRLRKKGPYRGPDENEPS
jgi:hypothetical protein